MACEKNFIETDLIVPCACCSGLFLGNYSNQGNNCAEINFRREVLMQVKKYLIIYQCKKFKANKGGNSEILNFIEGVDEEIEEFNGSYVKIVAFDQDFTKVKEDVDKA